jgi:hypothetical protein
MVTHERDQLDRSMEGVSDDGAAVGGQGHAKFPINLSEDQRFVRYVRAVKCGKPRERGPVVCVGRSDCDWKQFGGDHAIKNRAPRL